MPAPVCLYLLGEAGDDVAARLGTYTDWFGALAAEHPLAMVAVDGRGDDPGVDVRDYAALVLTGSASSLTEREPWMDRAIDLVREAHARGTPVLGVCFGHQMIAEAFGGRVVRNPAGWELSTYDVAVNAAGRADPLFADLPDTIAVNLSHQDIPDPASLPAEVRVLASNAKTDAQAIAVGATTRGVQFHPEFSGAVVQAYVARRHQLLLADATARDALATDHPDLLRARARDSEHGRRVFGNFIIHFALR